MKKTKILASLIALTITMSAITGCGGVENTTATLPTNEEVAGNTEDETEANTEEETEAIAEEETEAIIEDETEALAENTDNEAASSQKTSTGSQKTPTGSQNTSSQNTSSQNTSTGSQNTSAQDTPVVAEPAQPVQTSPAHEAPGPVQTTPVHEHTWKEHIASETYWRPDIVIVPTYEYHCTCGFVTTDPETIYYHDISHEDENGVSYYSYDWVEIGTHEVDYGTYWTDFYVDYLYCDCGATKPKD